MTTQSHSKTIRFDEDLVRQIEAVASELSRRASGVEISFSDAVRTVLQEGLPAMKKKLGMKG